VSDTSLHPLLQDISSQLVEIRDKVTRTETNMQTLIGNGQPGRISRVEDQVKELIVSHERAKGYFAALGSVITLLGVAGHYLIDLLKKGH